MGCFLLDFQRWRFAASFRRWKALAATRSEVLALSLSQEEEVTTFNGEWTLKWEEEVALREGAEAELASVQEKYNQLSLTSSPSKDGGGGGSGGWSKLRRKKSSLTFANMDQMKLADLGSTTGGGGTTPRTPSSRSTSSPPVSSMPTMRRLSTFTGVVAGAQIAEKEREKEKGVARKQSLEVLKEVEEEVREGERGSKAKAK